MFSKDAATRAPSQNMLRANFNSYSNFTASGKILFLEDIDFLYSMVAHIYIYNVAYGNDK